MPKTCDDYPLISCCLSCHEDEAMGIEDVPLEVYDIKGKLYARVCCTKIKEAESELEDAKESN